MPRGSCLSDVEKGRISALKASGKSDSFIAKDLGRSRCVMQNYLKNPNGYGQVKRSGSPWKLSKQDERRVVNAASNSTRTCKDIHAECNLNVSISTILRAIKLSPIIVRSKLITAAHLKVKTKFARPEFARDNMNQTWNVVDNLETLFHLPTYPITVLNCHLFFRLGRV